MNYTLGADQTQPAGLILNLIAPTDANRITEKMAELIKGYYPGNWFTQEFNLDLWRKLGFDAWRGPLPGWLEKVVAWERTNRRTLEGTGSSSASAFSSWLLQNHADTYRSDDNDDYIRAWGDMLAQGLIPDTLKKPWTYTPTSGGIVSDVAAAAGQAVGSAVKASELPIVPLALGAVAVYALISVFLPKILTGRS